MLGGNELNFSSDVDLIFAYPESGATQGGRQQLDNQSYFTRLGQMVIRLLDAVTEEAFVFRVDMRLRPYGDSGALVGATVHWRCITRSRAGNGSATP